MNNINVKTEFIKLDQLLKLINIVSSGGEAKFIIQEGKIKVNGEIEIRRGKKIVKGDIISVDGFDDYKVI